jgi:hypothetical protein
MIQQLTRDRKSFLRWGTKSNNVPTAPAEETTYTHDGTEYKILPLDTYNDRIAARWNTTDIAWFSAGVALVAFLGGYTFAGEKPPLVVEKIVPVDKPIVVEKPMPVNSGCLAFCNR